MADQRFHHCSHHPPGRPRVCWSCANAIVSQAGQGEGTSLPAGSEAAFQGYYASQQMQPALSQAHNDLARLAGQPLRAGTDYGDNTIILNNVTGAPGPGYPYAQSLDSDPAFASTAQTNGPRPPPIRPNLPRTSLHPANQEDASQNANRAQMSQRRSRQPVPRTQRPPLSWQQSQRPFATIQQARGNRVHQAQPRDGSSSGQYTAPRQSRQQYQRIAEPSYYPEDQSDDGSEAEGYETDNGEGSWQ